VLLTEVTELDVGWLGRRLRLWLFCGLDWVGSRKMDHVQLWLNMSCS